MYQHYLTQFTEIVTAYVPNLLGAFLFLVAGWFIALIVSAIVGGLIGKTPINAWLAETLEDSRGITPVDGKVKTITYWAMMIFVLVGFFQILGLTVITEPLNNMLNQITVYAPRILFGFGLLILAWIVGNLVKATLNKVFSATRIDERVSEKVGWEREQAPIGKTVADTGYWLTLLFFLPSILNAFALEGMLQPVNLMVGKMVAYVPNIFSAGILLALGWFFARILQQVTTNLLKTVGTDRISEQLGISRALGQQPLSHVMGTVVYIVFLVPVIIAALDALAIEAVVAPAKNVLTMVMNAVPMVLGGVLVLLVGYVLARVAASIVTNVLTGIGFNNVLLWVGIARAPKEGATTPAAIMGTIAMVAIMYVALVEALHMMGFETLTTLLSSFLVVVGQIMMGLVIFGIGLFLSNLAAKAIKGSNANQASLLAMAARISIIVLAGAMALRQMGLANEIIQLAFGILLGAIGVAIAIAFGLGGREVAHRELETWVHELKHHDREPVHH